VYLLKSPFTGKFVRKKNGVEDGKIYPDSMVTARSPFFSEEWRSKQKEYVYTVMFNVSH
jgi:hypothetical protein